jgi:rhodanese-related sulfurtransferase
MDKPKPISPTDLYLELGTARAPVLIDVRTDAIFEADDRLIVGARRLPENVDQWKLQFAKDHRFVVYGSQGDETSQGVAEALGAFRHEAAYLEGGFAAWVAQGLPTRKQLAYCMSLAHPPLHRPRGRVHLCAGRAGARRGQGQGRYPLRHSRWPRASATRNPSRLQRKRDRAGHPA